MAGIMVLHKSHINEGPRFNTQNVGRSSGWTSEFLSDTLCFSHTNSGGNKNDLKL